MDIIVEIKYCCPYIYDRIINTYCCPYFYFPISKEIMFFVKAIAYLGVNPIQRIISFLQIYQDFCYYFVNVFQDTSCPSVFVFIKKNEFLRSGLEAFSKHVITRMITFIYFAQP